MNRLKLSESGPAGIMSIVEVHNATDEWDAHCKTCGHEIEVGDVRYRKRR